MPFEGDVADFTKISPPVIETPAQRTIRQARELIASPTRWVRTWQSGEAFCILGALRHVHHGDACKPGTGGAQEFVTRVLRRRGYTGITSFNDFHASHVHVLAVLDAAYEMAGKPKGAKIDLSAIPRKGEYARPRATCMPKSAPITYKPATKFTAGAIGQLRAMNVWVMDRHEGVRRVEVSKLGINLPLLAALARRRLA